MLCGSADSGDVRGLDVTLHFADGSESGPCTARFFCYLRQRWLSKNGTIVLKRVEQVGRRRKKNKRREEEEAPGPSKPLTSEVQEALQAWAKEAAEVHSLILYDLEISGHGRWLVKVYVDQPVSEPGKGISAAECADVSRYLETIFDADERVPERYVLEVSSPGIERPIKNARHVDLAVGQDVELVLREPVHGKNKIIGQLLSHEAGRLQVETTDETVEIDWEMVARAKVKFDFSDKSEKR